MRTLEKMRLAGFKPRSVFVDLVAKVGPYEAEEFSVSDFAILNVSIEAADSLADIDFRPLHGLVVFVSDHAGNKKRHRNLAKLVADVEPSQLIFLDLDENGLTVHRRLPDRTESYSVGSGRGPQDGFLRDSATQLSPDVRSAVTGHPGAE